MLFSAPIFWRFFNFFYHKKVSQYYIINLRKFFFLSFLLSFLGNFLFFLFYSHNYENRTAFFSNLQAWRARTRGGWTRPATLKVNHIQKRQPPAKKRQCSFEAQFLSLQPPQPPSFHLFFLSHRTSPIAGTMNFLQTKPRTPPDLVRELRDAIPRLETSAPGGETRRKVSCGGTWATMTN